LRRCSRLANLNQNRSPKVRKKVVLLGVFGTPTSRYAMIRLPSGRVKKVKVGDTVDGGRIAAITADSVKYEKGNRIITLTL
jgi:type IV pilus biogenesis protein PilP